MTSRCKMISYKIDEQYINKVIYDRVEEMVTQFVCTRKGRHVSLVIHIDML